MKELPSETIRREVVLSKYIQSKFPDLTLTGGGGRFRCTCPIHGGSNPSAFTIDDHRGYWKCFSECGSGTIIDLWLRLHGKEDSEAKLAMESLAEESGVTIASSTHPSDSLSRHTLSKVVESVCSAAHKRLADANSDSAREALNYLYDRGLSDTDLRQWSIGILPGRKAVVKFLTAAAAEIVGGSKAAKALEETQIIEASKYGDDMFSQFAGRILFPIRDASGNFVGISARILPSDDVVSEATGKRKSKYVNSRASDLFDKSQVMFGMHSATTYGKDKTSTVFVCEGQMDVISMTWVLDDTEIATATCGTALTEQHMAWLASFDNIRLMFDSDDAGRKALVKALPIVNICGSRNIRAVTLTSGKDANEIAVEDEDVLIGDLEAGENDYLEEVARVLWLRADESPHDLYSQARDALGMLKRSVERSRLVDALAEASGLSATDISREVDMSASIKKTKTSMVTKSDTMTVSSQIAPLSSWLSKLDTKTRMTLLLDMDTWLDSDYVTETLLNVQNDTDEEVLAFLSIGVGMSKVYGDDATERAETVVAMLAVSDASTSPRPHLVKIARLLLNDVRDGYLDHAHLPLLHEIATSRSELSEIETFLRLGELLTEVAEDDIED